MNHLHYGDNLRILREFVPNASVDLVYLDPPFNSNSSYNILFKTPEGSDSNAQIEAFGDIWTWGNAAEQAYEETLHCGKSQVAEMIRALRVFLGENNMMAYLAMMTVRLVELHRVLKDTGSIYLHCDPTASHYLRILMDSLFDARNFRNEITWRRATSHSDSKRFGRISDRILFYSKTDQYIWNGDAIRQEKSPEEIEQKYNRSDVRGAYKTDNLTGPSHNQQGGESTQPWQDYDIASRGRVWSAPKVGKGKYAEYIDAEIIPGYADLQGIHERLDALDRADMIVHPKTGVWPSLKRYAAADFGHAAQDIIYEPTGFTNYSTRGGEYLGYPTQKPVALLETLLKASSNIGQVVLDPFCGCGTTVHAAEKLNRNWVGIDITHIAVALIERRLKDAFPLVEFETHGVPEDLEGAIDLAQRDKHEFEKWAVSLIPDAQLWRDGKKGADQGVDGVVFFGQRQKAIISVKGGKNIGVSMIRDLIGALNIHKADIGVFLTLTPPTMPMKIAAAAAGTYQIEGNRGEIVPKVQIITIEDCLNHLSTPLRLPARQELRRKAKIDETAEAQQASLSL